MRTRYVLIAIGVLTLATLSTQAQWLDGWSFRRALAVDASQIDADLTDFPLLVRLTPGVVDFGLARADGFDIRFTAADGVTLLAYERERHDAASGTGIYWVRLPLVSSTTDTTFYVYYGNSAALDGANASGVWDSSHAAVWHLAQTNGVMQADSTVNANHLTLYGDVAENEPGMTGRGIGLSGSPTNPEFLASPTGSYPTLDTTAGITYSAWAYSTNTSAGMILNCGGGNWSPYWQTWFSYNPTSKLNGGSGGGSVSHGGLGRTVDGFTVNTWKHVAMTVFYDAGANESTLRLYINGEQVLNHVVTGQSLRNPLTGRPLFVGARTHSPWPANQPVNFFNGRLDEVRVCKEKRSEAWINASYRNQKPDSALLRLGNVESTVSWYPNWLYRRLITVKSAQIDTDLSAFPLMVRLTPGVLEFSQARADGFDIRFTAADGVTPLAYERELHNAADSTGIYWVQLPLVSSTTDTTFYLYYGNRDAPDGADPFRVWDSSHAAVWHLAQTNGATQADSTINANHLTLYGDGAEGEPGMTGRAIGLSGSTANPEYLATPPGSYPTIDTTAGLTYSSWAHSTNTSSTLIFNCGGGNWSPYWQTYLGTSAANIWGSSSSSGSIGHGSRMAGGFTLNTWKHVTMTVFYDAGANESTLRLYINGAQVLSHTMTGKSLLNPIAGRPLVVGARTFSWWPGNQPDAFFNGWLDEVRVCKERRSEAWIAASYRNQKAGSALLSWGDVESTASWYPNWEHRRLITVKSTQIDADLSDFPLLVRLTPRVLDFGLARADGFDIRFTAADGMTPLDYEREQHDAVGGKGLYWVRVPLVSSTTNTTFYLYYGNSNAPDGADPFRVWDSDHAAVWHLAQANGATQADSTAHANHLTLYGDVAEGETGITGHGIGLSGSAENPEYLANPPGFFPTIDTTAGLTYSAWAYTTNTSAALILNLGGGNWMPWWSTWFGYSTASQLTGYSSSSVNHGDFGQKIPGFTVDTWKHVAMTVFYDAGADESTLRLYINGEQVLSNVVAGRSLRNPLTERPLVMGARTHSSWPGSHPDSYFKGWLDEVRVSKVSRSEAWVSASYRNQQPDSTLLSFGGLEPPTGTMVIIW